MLTDDQARALLARCESAVGNRLETIRRKLLKGERYPALWELVLFDAALELGEVDYEPLDAGPDLKLTLESGEEVWLEANWMMEAYQGEQRLMDACNHAVWAEADSHGVSASRVNIQHGGETTVRGVSPRLPEEHRLRDLTQHELVQSFLRAVSEAPDEHASCDLGSAGFSVTLRYDPKAREGIVTSGGVVPAAPLRPQYHPVYKALRAKASQSRRAFKAAGVSASVVVCLGGRRVHSLRASLSPSVITPEKAAAKAFRENRTLAGALVCPFRDERRRLLTRLEPFAVGNFIWSSNSNHPPSEAAIQRLLDLDLNRWKYRFAGSEHEGPLPLAAHQARRGGRTEFARGQTVRLKISENLLLQFLKGDGPPSDVERLREEVGRAVGTDRRVVSVQVIEADPRAGEPAYLEFEFGPETPPVFAVKREA